MNKSKFRSILSFIICYSLVSLVFSTKAIYADTIKERLKAKGELAPFPEAQPFLSEIAKIVDSPELKTAIKDSRTLQMLRERLRTSLYHLNFEFEVAADGYPYTPPFEAPFPFRPTLETIEEAQRFFENVKSRTGFDSGLSEKIDHYEHFADLKILFPERKTQSPDKFWSKDEIAAHPVDAYIAFQERLDKHGESASFPEFAQTVDEMLNAFKDPEMRKFRRADKAFDEVCAKSIKELKALKNPKGGRANRLQAAHSGAYPYRKTIQVVERAVMAFDLRDRLKFPEGINWHDVEVSNYVGDAPKLLPLYHYNRYKYQKAGLLADHEVIVWPLTGGASFEFLTRIRSAPFAIVEAATKTDRIDRHWNSPLDNDFHDGNHGRRTWGYDQRKQERLGAKTREQKIAIYREQEKFTQELLAATDPKAVKGDEKETNLRKLERLLIFETIHETALTPDRDSLLKDLLRKPATRQPFEVQIQAAIADLENIRSFDGNLRSGADQLALNLSRPTLIRYFMDRAPGFLANVDNKIRWGFFDSVFNMKKYVVDPKYRHPIYLAEAALRLFERLGYENPPSKETLIKEMTDHSGQPELWNYFGLKDKGIVRLSRLNMLNVAAAKEIHDTWRRNSAYEERWKPTNAKLIDGTMVNDQWSLDIYFKEKKIPDYLQKFYRLQRDPHGNDMVLWEDIRNLPNDFLAPNHQGENLMSGAKAVATVDMLWQREMEKQQKTKSELDENGKLDMAKQVVVKDRHLKFAGLDSVERWLVAAAQTVHQAVLDRNANGARNNPEYNVHWLNLPARNKMNDLELIRIAFEARLKIGGTKLLPETVMMFNEGLSRLYGKIHRNEPISGCTRVMAAAAAQ